MFSHRTAQPLLQPARLRRRPLELRVFYLLAALLTALALPSGASAQEAEAFDAHVLRPAPSQRFRAIVTDTTRTLPARTFEANAFYTWAAYPLTYDVPERDMQAEGITALHTTHLLVGAGVTERLELNLDVPIVHALEGDQLQGYRQFSLQETTTNIGAIRFGGLYRFFGERDEGVSLAASLYVNLPTGPRSRFIGGDLRIEPRLVFQLRSRGGYTLALSAGYAWRPERNWGPALVNDRFVTSAALILPFVRAFHFVVDTSAKFSFHERTGPPIVEVLGAPRFNIGRVMLQVGAGVGLADGVGEPDYRVIASLGYTNAVPRLERRSDEPTTEPVAAAELIDEAETPPSDPTASEAQPEPTEPAEPYTRALTINFAFDSWELSEADIRTIQSLAADVREAEARDDLRVSIRVDGHSDSVGDADYNRMLSEARAANVRAVLLGAGIPATQITTRALGSREPLAPNDDDAGRAQNRRVEIHVEGTPPR